jgi:hypothetical protein
MADQIVSWGGVDSKGTAGMGVTGSFQVSSSANSFFVGGSNVGIGTPTPSASLHISGASSSNLLRIDSPASSNILFVSGSGNVGIGTSSPATKLDLVGSYKQTQASGIVGLYNITTANADQVRGTWDFYTSTAITPDFFGRFGFKFEGGVNNVHRQFQVHVGDATTPKLIVNGSGNIGIGTTSPTARLQVRGSGTTSSTTALLVENANASASLQVYDSGQVYFPNGDISYGAPSGPPLKLNITQPTGTATYAGVNIGHLNTAVSSNVTIVGGRNTINDQGHFVFGHQNNVSAATSALIFGTQNTQNTNNGTHIMVGNINLSNAYTNGQNASIIIGTSNSTNGFWGGGLIGSSLKYYADGQLAFGGNSGNVNFALREIYFGNGVRNENIGGNSNNGHGPSISINTSQAYSGSLELNRNGGNISLRGGQGTGTGSAGDVIFATATTGSDGATYHSYSNRVWVKGHTGNVGIGTATPSASLHISGSSNSALLEIDSPAVSNILYVSGSGNVGIGTGTPSASLHVSGAILNYPITLPTASGTASMDCSKSNFFNLTLSGSYTLFLSASNIQPGQTINLRVIQPATSGSLNYGSQFKFAGGIPYSASATSSTVDIISFISFDTTTLYGSAIKNLS